MKRMIVTVNGKRYDVQVDVLEDDEETEQAPPGPQVVNAPITPPIGVAKPRVDPEDDGKTLRAPISGVLLEVHVAPGQTVHENDIMFVLEVMKMKTTITSAQDGMIAAVKAKIGDAIEAGQVLATFE